MTNSASSLMAIILGVAVFAVIVAVGWRSVQNRRILRLQSANGQETIVVANEDDGITSVVASTQTVQPAQDAELPPARSEVVKRNRLKRVVASTK